MLVHVYMGKWETIILYEYRTKSFTQILRAAGGEVRICTFIRINGHGFEPHGAVLYDLSYKQPRI